VDWTIWTLFTLHAEVFVSVQVLHPYTANDCLSAFSCQLVGTCISILDSAWILLHPFITDNAINLFHTRMWANAQRDGSPVEYTWHPLFNAAKCGWRPLLECCAVTLPRCETLWNLQGCPRPANGSQPIVGRSSPYYEDIWTRYWCLTSYFFRLSIYALVAKIQPNKVVQLCADGDFLHHFCLLYFQQATCSTFQTCILNLH